MNKTTFSPHFIQHRFTKFLLVGFINSIVGYGCYALLLYIDIHYSLSLLIATIIGVIFNFKTIGTLVFETSSNSLIGRFFAVYLVLYILNILGIKMLLSFGILPLLGAALLIPPMAVTSYVLNRRFVFNHDKVN